LQPKATPHFEQFFSSRTYLKKYEEMKNAIFHNENGIEEYEAAYPLPCTPAGAHP